MPPTSRRRPRVFVDADALFAGAAAASDHGASLVILRLAEITLIEAVTSQQAVTEAERNLGEKLPQALPAWRLIVSRCLRVVPDPQPMELLARARTGKPTGHDSVGLMVSPNAAPGICWPPRPLGCATIPPNAALSCSAS